MFERHPNDDRLSNANCIEGFAHCTSCFGQCPAGVTPREWARLEAGLTKRGMQIWCVRCEANLMHVDYEGQQHPVTTTRAKAGERVIDGGSH